MMRDKISLYFLSGLMCDDTVWQEIADQLSDIANVSMMSFRGFNSIEKMAEKVLSEASAPFSLIGHSMGGRVALEAYRKAPDQIERLGLFNTGVHPRRETELAGRQILLDIADNQGMPEVAKVWLPPMMAESGLNNPNLMAKLESMVIKYKPEEFHDQIKALLERPNAEAVLPLIKVPTLLLSGTEDKWSPISQHEEMQKEIANSTLIKISDAGHMAPVEQPTQVSSQIRQWLES